MKNITKYILIFWASLLLWSCEDYLDIAPEQEVTPEDVYKEFNSFREFSDYLYFLRTDFRDWFHRSWPAGISDEGSTTNTSWGYSFRLKQGDDWMGAAWYTTAEIGVDKGGDGQDGGKTMPQLGNSLLAIRHANICLQNFELLVDATQEQKDGLLGEVYYFRAFNYFQMIKRWGGMPKLDKVFTPDDDFDLERLTYQESTDWIVEDLDKAIGLLPNYRPVYEQGRITKGMALALKEMVILYAASPLMNADKGYTYNSDRCIQGVAAAVEVLKLEQQGVYRLLDWSEYTENFYSKTQPVTDEDIIYVHFATREKGDMKTGGVSHRFGGFQFFVSPTQNAVDMYETTNGLPIDVDPDFDAQNPYANRDPRLASNIFLNGDLVATQGSKNYYFEPYIGGLDDPTQAKVSGRRTPRGGYMMKKFWPPKLNRYENAWTGWYSPWVEMRLAQVYLDFAEMANEVYGPSGAVPGTALTALSAINTIRNRVGMPDVNSRYTGSKEDFRERIRNERAVELMFEGIHRWHDLRRWHIAIEKLDVLRRANITRNGDGTFVYDSAPLDDLYQVTFKERNYWYPLPKDDVYMLSNLKQNPGW